jgi:hypothetical protein
MEHSYVVQRERAAPAPQPSGAHRIAHASAHCETKPSHLTQSGAHYSEVTKDTHECGTFQDAGKDTDACSPEGGILYFDRATMKYKI